MNDVLTECVCHTPGQDDGLYTCWKHHNCSDGICTHQDGEDEEPPDMGHYDE